MDLDVLAHAMQSLNTAWPEHLPAGLLRAPAAAWASVPFGVLWGFVS